MLKLFKLFGVLTIFTLSATVFGQVGVVVESLGADSVDSNTVDSNCLGCNATESYQKEIALLIRFAEQIKELDVALEDLSPETIQYLTSIVGELAFGDASTTTIELALSKRNALDEDLAQQNQIHYIKLQTELANARQQNEEALGVLSDDVPASLVLESKLNEVVDTGVFVTFVRPAADSRDESVIMTINSRPRSFQVGSKFQYNGNQFELIDIVFNDDRDDGRSYDVWVLNSTTSVRELVAWAN